MIAVFLEHSAFISGGEREEAEALWAQVSQDAPRPLPLFEAAWFDRLWPARPVSGKGDPQRTTSATTPSSASATPNAALHFSVPFPPTPLIGRDAELAEIARLLGDPVCRLLTLLGPGGIGKTRLALAVTTDQSKVFSDGGAFVPLGSVGAPPSAGDVGSVRNQLVSAIGAALQLSFAGQLDLTAHLLDHLRDRRMLLVLDSFEYFLEGAELVSDMLQAGSQLTLLVTSQARLNLQAEWLFNVGGLSYPSGDWPGPSASPSLADLADYGAVQLFIQRARQVQPEFSLFEAALAAVYIPEPDCAVITPAGLKATDETI